MGRSRLPIELQKGHITVVNRDQRLAEEASVKTGRDQILKPPRELRDSVAKKEWRRIIEVLDDIDLIGNADRSNLIGYCNAFSLYMEAIKAEKMDPDEVQRWGKEMRDFEKLCYLTPDSRLKAAARKSAEKKDEMEALFGAI